MTRSIRHSIVKSKNGTICTGCKMEFRTSRLRSKAVKASTDKKLFSILLAEKVLKCFLFQKKKQDFFRKLFLFFLSSLVIRALKCKISSKMEALICRSKFRIQELSENFRVSWILFLELFTGTRTGNLFYPRPYF